MLAVLLLVGCDPILEPVEDEVELADIRAHMQGHLRDVTALRDAISMGQRGAAYQAIGEFLDHPVARGLPGDWLPRVAAMGEAAIGVRDAPSRGAMASHAARLAGECGGCHEAVLATVTLPAAVGDDSHAGRATVALDRLWAGLIEPSDTAFAAGLAALEAASLPDGSPVVVLARGAAPEQLAGDALTACGTCHGIEALPASPPLRSQVGSLPELR